MKVKGKVFVVTGGGSGIGRELVLELLRRGARVAAIDMREEGMAGTSALAQAGERLSLHQANVTDKTAVAALPGAVVAHHGAVDGLINCAGVIQPFVDFADLDDAVIDRMVQINLMGPINVTRAFLPALQARPEAHIANISSMGGFIPFPGQTMYSASKAAVKLMTEGLYAEMLDTNLGVSVIMPGAVATNITQNSGVEMPAGAGSDDAAAKALPAPEAARIILDGIEAGKLHILVGKDAKMLYRLVRIAPGWAIRFIQRQMKGLIKK